MSIPTAVFLDTSVLDGHQYNFQSTPLATFAQACAKRSMKLLLPDPTEREIRTQFTFAVAAPGEAHGAEERAACWSWSQINADERARQSGATVVISSTPGCTHTLGQIAPGPDGADT